MAKHIELAEVLRQRFFSGMHLGLLRPGARLPSARELEVELKFDRRTILRAYRKLEREGLVELKQRSGIYFSESAPWLPGLTPPAEWAVDVVAQAIAAGIPPSQFADRFQQYLSHRRLRALCVECNGDQLESLCAEMTSDYGFETDGADVDQLLDESTPRDELRQADLIVTTQFHAGEVKELSSRVNRPWIAVTLRTDIYSEIARLLPSGDVYFVVTDVRYAKKLERIFHSLRGGDRFHALVIGCDEVSIIPDAAPVYITRAARPRLEDEKLLQRVMPEERTFSLASAREILTLLIGSNIAALKAPSS